MVGWERCVLRPGFVIEKWLTIRWPGVFSIYTFALTNFLLVGVALACCLYACRSSVLQGMALAAVWLAFNRLSYALSVSANPEFLELAFLAIAWVATSRGSQSVQGASTAAALTKLVPVIFLIAPAIRRQWYSLIAFVVIYVPVVILVGYGQGMSPVQTALETVFPFHSSVRKSVALPVAHGEYLGLNSAIGRVVIGSWDGDTAEAVKVSLWLVQAITACILAGLVAACTWAIYTLHRSRVVSPNSAVALTYALLFGLMPLATLNAHQHTFIFLLPTFAALISVLAQDEPSTMRRAIFGSAFLACYVYLGVPAALLLIDRVLRSSMVSWWAKAEPIWGTLLLMGLMLGYVLVRSRSNTHLTAAVKGRVE